VQHCKGGGCFPTRLSPLKCSLERLREDVEYEKKERRVAEESMQQLLDTVRNRSRAKSDAEIIHNSRRVLKECFTHAAGNSGSYIEALRTEATQRTQARIDDRRRLISSSSTSSSSSLFSRSLASCLYSEAVSIRPLCLIR
jgi:predicted nucleotidyltransferase component of viral defense system